MSSLKLAALEDHSSEEEEEKIVEQTESRLARVYTYWSRFTNHMWHGFQWSKGGLWVFTTGLMIFWIPLWRAMSIADSMGEMPQQPPPM